MKLNFPSPTLLLPVLLALLPRTAPAQAPPDAAFRITGQSVISKPGYYRVANDFTVENGAPILIKSDGVTLDLSGHTITGNAEMPVIETGGSLAGYDNLRVTGGTLIGGHHGVEFTVLGAGVRKRFQVDHLVIQETTSAAIAIAGNNTVPENPSRVEAIIENNVIYSQKAACATGIMLAHAFASRVKGNTVTGCQQGLLMAFTENSIVAENLFAENASAGIEIIHGAWNRVTDNQLSSNGTYAISLSGSGNVIARNVFMNSKGTGLSIQPGPAFPSTGNIYENNRAGGGLGYDIAAGNVDAGGNLPLPVVLPPISEPAPKNKRRPH